MLLCADVGTVAVNAVPTGKAIWLDAAELMVSAFPALPVRINCPSDGALPIVAVANRGVPNVPSEPKTAAFSTSITGEGGT